MQYNQLTHTGLKQFFKENALDAETEEMLLEGHMDDEDDEEERTWRR